MTTSVKYTAFTGGLDRVNSAVVMEDGRMVACENFEERFGLQGYRRINGFERFDGQRQPHLADYSTQLFDAGTVAIVAGNTITGATVTAEVVSVTLTSGVWAAGTAAGILVLTNVTGSFIDNEKIKVSAANRADANGVTAASTTPTDPLHSVRLQAAIAYTRAKIAVVPGSGGILGIGLYNGTVYAARNAVGGLTAACYRSSAAGWVLVKDGLIPGGNWRFTVANFTGSVKTLNLFGCDGKNGPFRFDGTTYTKINNIYGTNATSLSSALVGLGAKTFVVVESDRLYVAGQAVTVWGEVSAGNFMAGTVTSWTSGTNTLVINATSFGGSGTLAVWHIGLTSFEDKPYDLIAHKDHMFLAYPLGQLQTSNLGDPLIYTTTAALFGLGDEITALLPLKGEFLAIYCRNSVFTLSGSSQINWKRDVLSRESGAIRFTAAEVAGVGVHADESGVRSLQATQSYGGYESATFSRDVSPILSDLRPRIIAATGHKTSQQYRIYGSDGQILVCTVTTPESIISPSNVSFSLSRYNITLTCASTGEMPDFTEASFMGTATGFVMREGVGTSFDGAIIDSILRLPFSHMKSPSNRKRFRKLILELSAPQTVTVNFKQSFDYADGFYQDTTAQSALTYGTGGEFNVSSWDQFNWSQPLQTQSEVSISGVGRNMSLLLWHSSSTDVAFALQGLILHYSILGLVR